MSKFAAFASAWYLDEWIPRKEEYFGPELPLKEAVALRAKEASVLAQARIAELSKDDVYPVRAALQSLTVWFSMVDVLQAALLKHQAKMKAIQIVAQFQAGVHDELVWTMPALKKGPKPKKQKYVAYDIETRDEYTPYAFKVHESFGPRHLRVQGRNFSKKSRK